MTEKKNPEQVSPFQSFGLGTKAEGRKPACLSICAPGTGGTVKRLSLVRGFQKDSSASNAASVTTERQTLARQLSGECLANDSLKRFHGPVSHRGGFRLPVSQAGESLGVCLLQSGAARYSGKNKIGPELAVIEGGKR